ncbi:MAG: motility associated factor glycosyltransferase family protein [Spirochaetes bacterium]|nr:motility associated factor glycosyltransferase family protein [Spirochaetota bacterium]
MRQEELFEKNVAMLKRRGLAVPSAGPEKKLCVRPLETRNGSRILIVDNEGRRIQLHSRTDPQKEAARWARGNTDGEEQIVFLFGLGAGYHVDALLKMNKALRIVAFEPSAGIFEAALKNRDLTGLIESGRVHIVLGDEAVFEDQALSDPGFTKIKFLTLPPYRTLFSSSYELRRSQYISWLNRRQINTATIKRFDRLWTSNTFRNAAYFFSLPGIEALKDKFTGLPAIVLCAGPTLANDIKVLQKIHDDAVVFAVDTALRPVVRRGIVPDFVVSVDPQWVNSFVLISDPWIDRDESELPMLICDPAVYPSTLKKYNGVKIVSSSVFAPGSIIERFSGRKGTIAAGGSVAVAAYDLARLCGADPIVMLGLDLSYSSSRTHLTGSFHEIYVLSKADRFETAGTQMTRYIQGGGPFRVEDKYGKPVLTDRRMMLYRAWFENQARAPAHGGKKPLVVNGSSGGLHIEGMKDMPIVDFMKEIKKSGKMKKDGIESLKKQLQIAPVDTEKIRSFLRFLGTLGSGIETVDTLASRGLSLVDSTGRDRTVGQGLARIAPALDEIDRKILSDRDAVNLLSMVMQTPIVDILRKTGSRENPDQAAENSKTLYGAISEGAKLLLKLFDTASRKVSALGGRQAADADKRRT